MNYCELGVNTGRNLWEEYSEYFFCWGAVSCSGRAASLAAPAAVMPKPGWAETMDPLPAQLDRITFAQWAYYKEKEDGCRRLDCEHHAAERNRNLCGSCRQGWFPARGKIGCALVAHLLDPDFDGGNVRVRRTCDCAHKTCLEIG